MIKKILLLAAGAALVLGLLYGRNLIPYAGTAIDRAQEWADSKIDTSYKIDTARRQLEKVRGDIQPMMYEIARQKVEINRLGREIENQDEALAKAHVHIMRLRDHLESGEPAYVSTATGRTFSNDRVREDLANQFRRYKHAEEHLNTLKTTLDLRQKGLEAAEKNLEESLARQRNLAVEIENLEAQSKMLEVAKTASECVRIDDSALSRVDEMIEEIRSRLETESMMLNMAPEVMGDIPMEEEAADEVDIIEAIDVYFGTVDDGVVQKN
jgi:chromosome segregation ATPase